MPPVAGGRRVKTEVQRFGTTTAELLRLTEWLSQAACTHVAMESTSVYWKPVFNLLEGSFEVVLANAWHIKAVPGRKTDVKDCAWIADLLAHGLIRASFIPPPPIRDLRDLTRYRKSLVRDRVKANSSGGLGFRTVRTGRRFPVAGTRLCCELFDFGHIPLHLLQPLDKYRTNWTPDPESR